MTIFIFLFCQVFTDFLLVFDHSAMKSMVYAKPTLCKYISRFNAESRAFSRKKWQADKNFAIPLKKCILQEKYGSIISKNHFNPFAPCFGHFYSFLDENSLKRLFHERHICYFPSSMRNTIISTIFLLSEHFPLVSNKKKKTQRAFVINYPKVLSSDKHSYCHSSFVTLQQTSEWNFWHLKRRKNGAIVCQNVWVLLSGVVLPLHFI